MQVFDAVDDSGLSLQSWRDPPRDRSTRRYEPALQWAGWILRLLSPSLRGGDSAAPALLFDMNRLFEQAVGVQLRLALAPSGLQLSTQDGGRHLAESTAWRAATPRLCASPRSGPAPRRRGCRDRMITGEIKSKVDRIWDTMWSGGISNPLSVIEQLTYLLFIKRLDELHTLKEQGRAHRQAHRGADLRSRSRPAALVALQGDRARSRCSPRCGRGLPVHQDARQQRRDGRRGRSTYSHHMKDAIFMMPTPRVLANVVDQLDAIDMADSDTKGDLYEYMLGKIASAGQNGQFRTPRHIIKLMVEMTAPTPKDVICDPACGTAGFLIAASEYLRQHHSDAIYKDAAAAAASTRAPSTATTSTAPCCASAA
jgi:hypothetical protein